MCTIGCVYEKGGAVHTFKQCDLTDPADFLEPAIVQGSVGTYLALRRKAQPNDRMWSGVNDNGVSFVAADYYTNSDPGSLDAEASGRFLATNTHLGPDSDVDRLFKAYESSIADHRTAQSAVDFLTDWYLHHGCETDPQYPNFRSPDIALFADGQNGIFIEYYPGDDGIHPEVRTLSAQGNEVRQRGGWFASTNHARMFSQTVDYPKNHSTYLRLARAEALLQQTPTFDGVKQVLSDQYYGKTELSICRVATKEKQYYTQATAIFTVAPGWVGATYQINGNPRTNPYKEMRLR
jgi:hypothetical protein